MKPKTKLEILVDVRPTRIESVRIHAFFDEALEILTEKGYGVISLAENAQLRIQQEKDSYISRNGNWTREGILYIPNENPRLVRDSPILFSEVEAVLAHKNGNEFYPTKNQIEKSLADSIDFPAESIEIPTDRFDSDALTVFAFGGEQQARDYGEFLRNAGINKMPVSVVCRNRVNKQSQPFVMQMWFRNLNNISELDCSYRDLRGAHRLRGAKVSF
ncbi:MAG: hypothetical protein AABW93_03335 [Nanoarchaeota archaeon]